jgi:hypothetical protein
MDAGTHRFRLVDDGSAGHGEAADPALPQGFRVLYMVLRGMAAHIDLDKASSFEQVAKLASTAEA